MTEMAHKFERRIRSINGVAHTSTTIFIFKDGSKLQFELKPNANAQADGVENSDAKKFASSVKTFTTTKDGYEFVFQDNSKLSFALQEGVTFHYPKP
ncbi:MAG TPA: hypothetical protein PLF42_01915 [Anaerolineales bacterium]|nr:hypothetical protein [Anaerolineales bacterium]